MNNLDTVHEMLSLALAAYEAALMNGANKYDAGAALYNDVVETVEYIDNVYKGRI